MDVFRARKLGDYTRHLKKGTSAAPQPADAKCPSGNQYGIECSCVDAGPAARMRPRSGANLVVVPAGLVANWLSEINLHLDMQDKTFDWQVRHGHADNKMNKLAIRLTDADAHLLEPSSNANGDIYRPSIGQCRLVCVTTRGCYKAHVAGQIGQWILPPKANPRSKQKRREFHRRRIAWGRVAADECHTEVSNGAGTILLFRSFGPTVRKWFLSGTPFERSPAQMASWVSSLFDEWWNKPDPSPAWPEKEAHRRNLRLCTPNALKELGKVHQRIVDGTETKRSVKLQHISNLTTVLRTLWIKRDADRSTFFDQPLTPLVPNTHCDIDCKLPDKFKTLVNSSVTTITDQLLQENEAAKQAWRAGGGLGAEPQINVHNWMRRVRRLRILSTFPVLGTLEDTKNLELTGAEDRQHGWVTKAKDHPYNLDETGSPYERHIEAICAESDCTKVAAINKLIDEKWDPEEKAVFCSMGPTPALVLYWVCHVPIGPTLVHLGVQTEYLIKCPCGCLLTSQQYLRKVRNAPVALIHSGMPKSLVMDIIWLFQEDPATMARYPGVEPPRYLVSTTRLIGVGYTLHKAKRLVQVDPEWYWRDHEQAKKRINRIGQTKPTSTYTLRCVGSDVELTIYDRQNRRTNLVKMALDPARFDQGRLQVGIGEDGDKSNDREDEIIDPADLAVPAESLVFQTEA